MRWIFDSQLQRFRRNGKCLINSTIIQFAGRSDHFLIIPDLLTVEIQQLLVAFML